MYHPMYLNEITGFLKNVLVLGGISILVAITLYAALLLFLPKRFAGVKISAKIGQFLLRPHGRSFALGLPGAEKMA